MRYLWLPLVVLLAIGGCKGGSKDASGDKLPLTRLNVFALEEIRSSGFEGAVLREFAKKHNCEVQLTLFPDQSSLLEALHREENRGRADLALGIDNSFALSDSLLSVFEPASELKLEQLNHDIIRDEQRRIVPYAYSNLAIIYNEDIFPDPPQSFGELQDARFYSQLAVCDPQTTGLGRNTLFWTRAIFGEAGYEQLWQSLRKNVRKVFDSPAAALEGLKSGDCGLMLGFISTPAWIEELNQSEKRFKYSVPKEGSFQYVEYAGLCKNATNSAEAVKLVQFLIDPDVQRQMMYQLGLLPVNARTGLPVRFASIPLSSYTLNRRLDKDTVREGLPRWLDAWYRIFVLRLGL